jgi:hypothetical protein
MREERARKLRDKNLSLMTQKTRIATDKTNHFAKASSALQLVGIANHLGINRKSCADRNADLAVAMFRLFFLSYWWPDWSGT